MKKSFASIYSAKIPFAPEGVLNRKREFIATENVDFEGRPIPSSVVHVDSPQDRYKGLTASDFALENQLAVGVQLNPVKCSLVNSYEEDSQIK